MRRIAFPFLVTLFLGRPDAIRAQSFEPTSWITEVWDAFYDLGLDAEANGYVELPQMAGALAQVQFVNHSLSSASVNVLIDDRTVLRNVSLHEASGFLPVAGGAHKVEVYHTSDESNVVPLFMRYVSFSGNERAIAILHDKPSGNLTMTMRRDIRWQATNSANADVLLANVSPLGTIDVRVLDTTDHSSVLRSLANNLARGEFSVYSSLTADGAYNVDVTSADNSESHGVFRIDLSRYEGDAILLTVTEKGMPQVDDPPSSFGVVGHTASGQGFYPAIVTSSEQAEDLPEAFVLHGNYPNPFNSSTRIAFDLPEQSVVDTQIVDMLGRVVKTLHLAGVAPGRERVVNVDAADLASGTYLYRVVARLKSGTQVVTGRMTLLK